MIIITPDRNVIKNDYRGAFEPEAKALQAANSEDHHVLVRINVGDPERYRRIEVMRALRERVGVGGDVAFICHGLKGSLSSFGIRKAHVPELADAIVERAGTAPVVALYACSAGGDVGPGGDGGFADTLRDALCERGAIWCRVFAHTKAGHCTKLPFVRVFEGNGSAVGGTGGQWIVAPGSKLWPAWRRALQKTDLRLRYPWMPVSAVYAELLAK